jgi:peptidoglycan/xylan/chitin deacetylase (PgdA/CDA1 family)
MLHRYFIKTPWWTKKVFPSYIWDLPPDGKSVYLTFDDGPDPEVTQWVLDQLKMHHALATFFCVGENVEKFPDVYQKILDSGHTTGNHSYSHFNGWQTDVETYINDVAAATKLIRSNLFRPPYGRIKSSQAKRIPDALETMDAKIIMWDVLSADFDPAFTPENCLHNVLKNVRPGSIVVFHDSEKASKNLKFALPRVMSYLTENKYQFKKIE